MSVIAQVATLNKIRQLYFQNEIFIFSTKGFGIKKDRRLLLMAEIG